MSEPPNPSSPDEPRHDGEPQRPSPYRGGPQDQGTGPQVPPAGPQRGPGERPGPGGGYTPPPATGPYGRPGQPQQGPTQAFPQQGGYPNPGGFPSQGYPQQDYGQTAGYQQQGYPRGYDPAAGYAQGLPAPAATGPTGLQVKLGARARRRPDARAGISLAGAGAALLVLGGLIWAGGYFGAGLDINLVSDRPSVGGEGRRFLGVAIFLIITVLGYAALVRRRRGPPASAGVVAAGFGVPLTVGFLSLSIEDSFRGSYPINLDAVYLVSIAAWLITYFFVPGARGRAFFLAAAALGLSSYVGIKAAGDSVLQAGFSAVSGGGSGAGSSGTGTVAAVGIVFGLVYYGVAAALDRSGRHGAAVALVVAGFLATVSGIAGSIPDLKVVGTGIELLILGLVLATYGGYFGRRFTAWVWSAAFLIGVLLLVYKAAPHSYTGAGISLMVIGLLVVAGAQLLSTAIRERPDVDETEAAPVG